MQPFLELVDRHPDWDIQLRWDPTMLRLTISVRAGDQQENIAIAECAVTQDHLKVSRLPEELITASLRTVELNILDAIARAGLAR